MIAVQNKLSCVAVNILLKLAETQTTDNIITQNKGNNKGTFVYV